MYSKVRVEERALASLLIILDNALWRNKKRVNGLFFPEQKNFFFARKRCSRKRFLCLCLLRRVMRKLSEAFM